MWWFLGKRGQLLQERPEKHFFLSCFLGDFLFWALLRYLLGNIFSRVLKQIQVVFWSLRLFP